MASASSSNKKLLSGDVELRSTQSLLISEVCKRPYLWDYTDINYSNRTLSEKEWDNIAKVVGFKKEIARQKWKSLRDNYRKELKKVKKIKKIFKGSAPRPVKWVHFKEMSFLRDIITLRKSSFSPERGTSLDSETSNDNDGEDDSNIEPNVPPSPTHSTNSENMINWTVPANSPDSDLFFLKSLYPFMKVLTPLKKLQVRNEIHNLLMKEIIKEEKEEIIEKNVSCTNGVDIKIEVCSDNDE